METLKNLLARILRLPPSPKPPTGTAATVQVFRASRNYYNYRLLRWAWGQAWALIGIVFGLLFLPNLIPRAAVAWLPFDLFLVIRAAEVFGVVAFLSQLFVSHLLIVLDYEYRWYFVTDSSLRIREGLYRVREQTMTFANVQNLSVRQGPLQRILGIQDLEVRTAGGGGKKDEEEEKKDNLHVARFRGVSNAQQIREQILVHLRQHKGAGLGDRDEHHTVPHKESPEFGSEIASASRDLLSELRSLRKQLEA